MTRGYAAAGSRRWILLLGLSSGLSAFGMSTFVPALPAIAASEAAGFGLVQFIVSGYLLGLGLAQPIQGLLCDRYGRRPVLLAGFLVFFFASVLGSLAPTLGAVIAARVLQALGVSVATVVARAMVRDTHDAEGSAVALSFITGVMGVAPIVGPIAGGLVSARFGWQANFVMHALISALMLVWIHLSLAETRPAQLQAGTPGQLLQGLGSLARDKRFLAYASVYGFSGGAAMVFMTVGADLFARLFGLTAPQFGLIWAVMAVAYTIGAWSAGFLARRFASGRVLRAGTLLTVTGGAIFGAAAFWPAATLAAFMLGQLLQTGANGLTTPLALAGAVGGRPDLAGVAAGASSSIAMLLSMAFAALGGALYDGTPQVPAAIGLAGCVLALLASRIAVPRSALRGARG